MLGGTLVLGGTLGARAQPATNVRRIGILETGFGATPAEMQQFWESMRPLGWIEGQNLVVEYRYAGGKPELLRPYAEELVRLNVEIIGTYGNAAAIAATNATTRISIVMMTADDPVRAGLVASLARPGGNVTGFSFPSELVAKRLELLRELLPTAQRIGVLLDSANPSTDFKRQEFERRFRSLGMQPIIVEVAAASELENAVAEVARRRAQALMVPAAHIFHSNRVVLMRAALRHALPTIIPSGEYVEAGGLLSLDADSAENDRIFAYFVDKILRGAKPADLPVQQPSRFALSINLKTAKALGLTIPQSLVLRADEVIQ
jgi:putative ABC transport system substrate-binding protein